VTRRTHHHPRLDLRLHLLVCFVSASGCATLPAVKPAPAVSSAAGRVLLLTRVHERAVFEEDAPAELVSPITDSYLIVPFRMTARATVAARVLGDGATESQVLVPRTKLPPGDYYWVVSYDDVASAIGNRLDFTLEVITADGATPVVHASLRGTLAELVRGDMLSQVVQSDVFVNDGHLESTMTDLELDGRGPDLSMERDYSNRPDPQDVDSVLGPGWIASLPLRLQLIASGETPAPHNLPAWVVAQRGAFHPISKLPASDGAPHRVYSNGTEFVRKGDRWSPERGRAGMLQQRDGTFIYQSMDGTLYTYPTPQREPLVIPDGADVAALPRAMLEPPQPAVLLYIDDRNRNRLTLTYRRGKAGPVLARATDCVGRRFEYEYAELDRVAGPGSRLRLVRVTGPAGDVLTYRYDEHGLLAAFQIADYLEEYEYGAASGSALNPHFNLERIRRPVQGSMQELSIGYFAAADVPARLLQQHPGLPATGVVRNIGSPGNHDVFFRYEPDLGNRRVVAGAGRTTVYRLNAYGNTIARESKGQASERWTWGIDQGLPGNFMTSHTEGDRVTKYEHDARGKVTRTVYPDGRVITQRWDPFCQLLESRSAEGLLERHEYDARGNEIKRVDADGESNRANNSYGDRVLAFDSAADALSAYRYDQYGNLSQVVVNRTDGLGWSTEYTNDARGRRLRAHGLDGYTEEFRYDVLGRVVFQRRGNEWSILSYDIDGDSRVIADSDAPQIFGRALDSAKDVAPSDVPRKRK
jgi:YD repeat-containing protein